MSIIPADVESVVTRCIYGSKSVVENDHCGEAVIVTSGIVWRLYTEDDEQQHWEPTLEIPPSVEAYCCLLEERMDDMADLLQGYG